MWGTRPSSGNEGARCLRENLPFQNSVPKGRLRVAQDGPGFPVKFAGTKKSRAAFGEESRIRSPLQSSVQEIRGSPGEDLTPRTSPEGTAENIPGCNPGLQHSPVGQELFSRRLFSPASLL